LKFTTYECFKFLRGGKINSILDELALLGLLMMLNYVSVISFLAKFFSFDENFICAIVVVNLNWDRFQLRFAS
jgi:hypothetical protein